MMGGALPLGQRSVCNMMGINNKNAERKNNLERTIRKQQQKRRFSP
jgi:hypothetical protein